MSDQIKEFDRAMVRELSRRIEEAVQDIVQDLGLSVKVAGGNFTPTSAKVSFEFAVKDESGQAQTRERTEFSRMAKLIGMSPDDADREFSLNGSTFRIAGYNRRARSQPLLIERTRDGKRFKAAVATVKSALCYEVSATERFF